MTTTHNGSAVLAALLLVAACTSGATRPSVDVPPLVGPQSLGEGAHVHITPEGIAGGVSGHTRWQPLHYDEAALREQLRSLHEALAQKARGSFSVAPDSVDVWIDSRIPFVVVRKLVGDLSASGFERIQVVGRAPGGRLAAMRLHARRPTEGKGPDLSLRWGNATKLVKQRRAAITGSLPAAHGLDGLSVQRPPSSVLLGTAPVVGVEVGTWNGRGVDRRYVVSRKDQCPAVSYGKGGEFITSRLGAIAASTCAQQGDGITAIGLAPAGDAPWKEVAALVQVAVASPGCTVALFLEPAGREPLGCRSPVPNLLGRKPVQRGRPDKKGVMKRLGPKGGFIGGIGMRGTGSRGGGAGFGGIGGLGGRHPKVRRSTTPILGACDRTTIKKVVQQHKGEIRKCYEKRLLKNPRLSGKVVMRWTIGKTGAVTRATVKLDTIAKPGVSQCVQGVFKSMVFPAPRGGGICIVSYPFRFTPGGASKPPPRKGP